MAKGSFIGEVRETAAKFMRLPISVRVMAIAGAVMCGTICGVLWEIWNTRLDYSFGFITPIFVAYILWIRKESIFGYFLDKKENSTCGSKYISLLFDIFFAAMFVCGIFTFAIFGFLFFLTNNRGVPAFTMSFGFSFAVFAMAYISSATDSYGNKKPLKERLKFTSLFIFPAFIWLISAPLFRVIEEVISMKLLSIVAIVDYSLMDAMGFVVNLRGNVIEFPKGSVGVAEACSGIRSLTACIFAGSFLAAAMLDKFWKQLALVLSSMFLAFFFNLCRSLFLALWAYENGSASISGTVHDTAGYIILGCTVVGLLILVQIFNINPVPKEFRELESDNQENFHESE